MLIKLDDDTISIMSLVVSVVGAAAAIIAAFYAKKAATSGHLTRVEHKTKFLEHVTNKALSIDTPIQLQEMQEASRPQEKQDSSQPQEKQEASQLQEMQEVSQEKRESSQPQEKQKSSQPQKEQEDSQALAQRISIAIEGEAMGEVPLELFLTLQGASVRVVRVETRSESGKTLGSSSCKATENALVFKSVLAPKKVRQWWGEEGRSVLRVYLLVDGSKKEVYRDMPVSIVEDLRNVGITSLVAWTIKGSI